jgi:maltooligosyltrehalose trehalohydrolase
VLDNVAADLELLPVAEPLLAPPSSGEFRLLWSSEDPQYSGRGTGQPYAAGHWRLPAHSALVFGSPSPIQSPTDGNTP